MERRHVPNPPARPLVLLVDDRHDALALNAIALSAMGFEVMAAADATEAFGRAWKNHPDIIVADLDGEETGGTDLIERLKDEPRTRDIPVVGLTEEAPSAAHERAARNGYAAFFTRSCLPGQLANKLREVLSPAFPDARLRTPL